MKPVDIVVIEVLTMMAAQHAAAPDGTGAGRSRGLVALDVS